MASANCANKIYATVLGHKRTTTVMKFAWDNYVLSVHGPAEVISSANDANRIFDCNCRRTRIMETRRKFEWEPTGLGL